VPQAPHAAPPVPHCEVDCEEYRTHVLPLQQPAGHEFASHTHWPFALHSCPLAHAAQLAPAVPQEPAPSEP
jgi:hypothetical protein